MKEKLLGSDDELVAGPLRLLWEIDIFLADAATDRVRNLAQSDRSTLIGAISSMRDALMLARNSGSAEHELLRLRRVR